MTKDAEANRNQLEKNGCKVVCRRSCSFNGFSQKRMTEKMNDFKKEKIMSENK